MKLLIVTQAADREDPNLGAFYYWFEMFARRVESVVILAGRAGAHNLSQNVAVYTFGDAHFGRIGRVWRFWGLFSRHYADANAVLFHQIPEYVIAASPFLTAKKKNTALWYAHGAVSWRLGLAERLVDYIFTSSAAGFRLPSKKAIYLGQAIHTDLFCPVPSAKFQVPSSALRMITIGRISPVKNFETMVEACAILRASRDRPFTLSVVGGPLTESDREYVLRIKRLIAEKKLESMIHFYGDVPYREIPEALHGHDMFINASRTGSLDKAVLEAMACGLTTLTSNEAYRAILPPRYFLEHGSAEFLAARIRATADESRPNLGLRAIVVRDHALERTMERMIGYLNTPV